MEAYRLISTKLDLNIKHKLLLVFSITLFFYNCSDKSEKRESGLIDGKELPNTLPFSPRIPLKAEDLFQSGKKRRSVKMEWCRLRLK